MASKPRDGGGFRREQEARGTLLHKQDTNFYTQHVTDAKRAGSSPDIGSGKRQE